MQFGLGEAIVGIRLDNLVGPVVAVGAGGLLAEIYKDVSIRPAPVSTDIARNMIAEVRGSEIFRGYRGRPAGDLNALAELISKISKLSRVSGIAEAGSQSCYGKIRRCRTAGRTDPYQFW